MDGITNNGRWYSASGVIGEHWIKIELNNPEIFTGQYRVWGIAWSRVGYNFVLQASNDDTNWIDLESTTHNTQGNYEFSNTQAYKYYRLYFTNGGWQYGSSRGWALESLNISRADSDEQLIPIMTGDNTPSGQITYSSTIRPACYAFNRVVPNTSNGAGYWYPTDAESWLAYEFENTVSLREIIYLNIYNATQTISIYVKQNNQWKIIKRKNLNGTSSNAFLSDTVYLSNNMNVDAIKFSTDCATKSAFILSMIQCWGKNIND